VMTAVAAIDADMRHMTRASAACRRLMTIPGVGQLTALAFVAAIDDPSRIRRSRDVGAYLGLVPRRYQSGEVDYVGGISKCRDRRVRTLLYEAANVMLTRYKRQLKLKDWAFAIAARSTCARRGLLWLVVSRSSCTRCRETGRSSHRSKQRFSAYPTDCGFGLNSARRRRGGLGGFRTNGRATYPPRAQKTQVMGAELIGELRAAAARRSRKWLSLPWAARPRARRLPHARSNFWRRSRHRRYRPATPQARWLGASRRTGCEDQGFALFYPYCRPTRPLSARRTKSLGDIPMLGSPNLPRRSPFLNRAEPCQGHHCLDCRRNAH
jgi:hypothetical protein